MNIVILKGNLGATFKTGATPGGTQILNVSLATNKFKTTEGHKKKKTSWHRLVFFGRTAENAINLLKKGDRVLIEGELETRSWQDTEKGWQSVTEVIVKSFELLKRSNSYQHELDPQEQYTGGYQNQNIAAAPAAQGQQVSSGVMVYNPEEAQA